MAEEEFDALAHPYVVHEDSEILGEFVTSERGRYPLAVAPIRVKTGTYTVRLQKGLLDRERVVLDVDERSQTISVYRSQG